MKESKEIMKTKFLTTFHLLLGFILLAGFEAKAQVSVQTAGVPEKAEQEINSQTEKFLTSILEGDLGGYTKDILSDDVKSKLAQLELITDENTVNTTALRTGNGYEVWGILMKPSNKQNIIEKVVLEFSSIIELTNVKFGDELSNTAWIVARNLKVSDNSTKELLNEILLSYEGIIEEKNSSDLKTLFAEEGFIISSTASKVFDGFEIVKYSNTNYLNRLSTNIFRIDNNIQVNLDDVKMYHHPVYDEVYGISARQTWISTFYADQGHVFFVVDCRGAEPEIYSRIWQKDPFKQLEFIAKELDSYGVQLSHKELLRKDIARSFDGEIQFVIKGEKEGLITPELLVEIIEDGTFRVDGVELETAHLKLSEGNLVVPFSANPKKGEQFVLTSIYMAESQTLKELNTKMKLYTDRRNVIELEAGNELELREEPNYFGRLNLSFNTDSANLKLKYESGRILTDEIIADSSVSLELLEGRYYLYVTKPGFHSVQDTIDIRIGELMNKELILESLAPKPGVVSKPKGFIAKNKYWLIGGAAAFITSTAVILTTGGSTSPGIPIPPGRPGLN